VAVELRAFIEINPEQARLMLWAYRAEQDRKRHDAEPWPGQAERDAHQRNQHMYEANILGVPIEQINRFVFGA
jgi:hypothetical protein